MKTKIFFLIGCLYLSVSSIAATDHYSGPDKPIIAVDNQEIRIKLEQCIDDVDEVMSDNEAHDSAKELCQLREKHLSARQRTQQGLAGLVKQFKGFTNQDHDQNLTQTIALIQEYFKTCIDALASQEYCHNFSCVSDPENDAIFCNNQSLNLINKILMPQKN